MNYWLLLKERMEQELKTIKIDLENNKDFYEYFDNIKQFLNSYEKGNIDITLLSNIPNNIINEKEIEQFIHNISMKNKLSNNSYFQSHLEKM